MLAVGYMKYGGPEVLEIFDLPEIHAGPGQLRIRNRAATVNPTDIMARSGLQSQQQKGIAPPYVPGMEAAGVVDALQARRMLPDDETPLNLRSIAIVALALVCGEEPAAAVSAALRLAESQGALQQLMIQAGMGGNPSDPSNFLHALLAMNQGQFQRLLATLGAGRLT